MIIYILKLIIFKIYKNLDYNLSCKLFYNNYTIHLFCNNLLFTKFKYCLSILLFYDNH